MSNCTGKKIVKDLERLVDGEISASPIICELYATDASMFRIVPQLVFYPKNIEDLQKVMRYAAKNKIPVTPRGAGTGLAGESLNTGIIVDLSVHFNRIHSVNLDHNFVHLDAGVVLADLNENLGKYKKVFGPDPATGSRCTLGGMIANNSTGAHSLRYGMTRDWVLGVKLMLYNGEIVDFGIDAPIRQGLEKILSENKELIETAYPDTPRNRHGYLLQDVLDEDGSLSLAKLICASEGTLGIILEAKLLFSDMPKHTELASLLFKDRNLAAKATPLILKYDPSAVEIIDDVCLGMARKNDFYRSLYPESVGAVLLVEFDGDDSNILLNKINDMRQELFYREELVDEVRHEEDPQQKKLVWEMRKLIAGMINRVPGVYQPVPLIEDVCVRPEKLYEYFEGIGKIFDKYQLKHLCFGHAGDGVVHVRPFLDLKSKRTYDFIPQLCHDIYDLSLSLEGSISGEHGDGLLRAPFIQKQYGDLFNVFVQIKRFFDPLDILNPGKKVDSAECDLQKNLRYGEQYKIAAQDNILHFEANKLIEMVEACNGCGQCRTRNREIDMCPAFRGLSHEKMSTRAKANLMRALLTGQLKDFDLDELWDVAKTCINCKACSIDCPSNVSAGDIMLELKARLRKLRGDDLATRFILRLDFISRFMNRFSLFANAMAKLPFNRFFMEKVLGIDRTRPLPQLSGRSFVQEQRSFQRKHPIAADAPIYFVDFFADIMNPHLARSAVDVFRHNGIELQIPEQASSGIVALNYGNVAEARKLAKLHVETFYPLVEKGAKIICTEPTAALMLKDEYAFLFEEEPRLKLIAENTWEAMEFLYELQREGKFKQDFCALAEHLIYHRPCHLKKLHGKKMPFATMELLSLIPHMQVEYANAGCCGMAGTFGMKRSHREVSESIGENLFTELARKDIDAAVTECSTCKMQMEFGVPGKRVFHPLEILARAYGIRGS